MIMDRKMAKGILNEMMGPPTKPNCSRCADLEAALRKVDEIRQGLKARRNDYHTAELVDALKAPCMAVNK